MRLLELNHDTTQLLVPAFTYSFRYMSRIRTSNPDGTVCILTFHPVHVSLSTTLDMDDFGYDFEPVAEQLLHECLIVRLLLRLCPEQVGHL